MNKITNINKKKRIIIKLQCTILTYNVKHQRKFFLKNALAVSWEFKSGAGVVTDHIVTWENGHLKQMKAPLFLSYKPGMSIVLFVFLKSISVPRSKCFFRELMAIYIVNEWHTHSWRCKISTRFFFNASQAASFHFSHYITLGRISIGAFSHEAI